MQTKINFRFDTKRTDHLTHRIHNFSNMSESLNSSQKQYLRSVEVILSRPMARRQKALAVLLLGAPLFGAKAFGANPAQDDLEESEVITFTILRFQYNQLLLLM